MAERIVHDCDRCAAQGITTLKLHLEVGTHFDGVETVTETETFDLCHLCMLAVLLNAINTVSFNFQKAMAQTIRDHHTRMTNKRK